MEQPDVIRRELIGNDLPKKAFKVLNKCDRLVVYYQQHRPEVKEISLFPRDYRELAKTLQEAKLDIRNVTYRGFGLKRAEV